MDRLKNIAKTWQRLALPSGGWGVLLLTAFMLLAGMRYASAQENTSAAPYINSTHRYRVKIGDMDNSAGVNWQLRDPSNNVVGLGSFGTPGLINKAGSAEDSAYVDIKFENNPFGTNPGMWTLIYSEESASTGACVAVRSLNITPVPNLFNLVMDDKASACNSYSGTIFDNTVNDISAITGNSSVPFNVKMNKALNFRLKEWSFTGSVTVSGCNTTAVLPSVVVTPSGAPVHGSLSFTGTGSNFTGRVTGINPADDFSTDDITFNIVVNGSPTADYVITLNIVGTALSGTNYTVSTGENNATDNEQENTIYGIPNTSVVSVTP